MGSISLGFTGNVYSKNLIDVPTSGYDVEVSVAGFSEYDEGSYFSGRTEFRGTAKFHINNLGNGIRPYLYVSRESISTGASIVVSMGSANYTQTSYWEFRTDEGEWLPITNNRIDLSHHETGEFANTIVVNIVSNNIARFDDLSTGYLKITQWEQLGANIQLSDIEQLENYAGEGAIEDDSTYYYMYNTYARGIGNYDGFNKTGDNTTRNETLYMGAGQNIALYYSQADNSLNLVVNQDKVYQVYAGSGNGMVDYGTTIQYRTFYNYWQQALGETIGASVVNTNIPVFTTLSQAQDYLAGIIDASSAVNYDSATGGANPHSQTGLKEIETVFADTYHTGAFGIQLACSISALREIASNIFTSDASQIENIKKGLEMYGENPIDSIIDLTYYPFDITSVIHNTVSQSYINFGAYRLALTNSINRIVYSNGYIDCGTVDFSEIYHNWVDYTHVGILVYLPYIGMKSLDPADYMGKRINVRYYFDFHTRACTACITADGLLTDYFEGQIGISQPICARDFASYAENSINTLVSSGASLAGTVATLGIGTMTGLGGVAGAVSASLNAGTNAGSNIAENAYNFVTNRAQKQSKGNFGSDTGGHLPQYVFFKFTYEDPIEPNNLSQLHGRPSNAGGTVASFGGFLKCSSVQLKCNRATAKEREEIKSLLRSGVYL